MINDSEIQDDGLEKLIDELNADFYQYTTYMYHIDTLLEQVRVLELISNALHEFNERLRSVEQPLIQHGENFSNYLMGYFYSATVGAYEVFMHDLMHALTESDLLFIRAKEYIIKTKIDNSKEINVYKLAHFKNEPSKENFRKLMHSATLLDAKKVSYSVEKWFEIEIPVIPEVEKIVFRRNLFTHNGGKHYNNNLEAIEPQEILDLIHLLDCNVAECANEISKKLDDFSRLHT